MQKKEMKVQSRSSAASAPIVGRAGVTDVKFVRDIVQ